MESAAGILRRERESATLLSTPGTCKTRRSCWPLIRMLTAACNKWLYAGRARNELKMSTVLRLSV